MKEAVVNVKGYAKRKADGTVKLQRLGPNAFQLVAKRFDPETGREIQPAYARLDLKGVEEMIEQVRGEITEREAGIAALEALRDDLIAAENAGPPSAAPGRGD